MPIEENAIPIRIYVSLHHTARYATFPPYAVVDEIDSIVVNSSGIRWRFTGFYRSPESGERHHSWTLMRRLSEFFNLPWLCCGYFNEISAATEKKGGNVICAFLGGWIDILKKEMEIQLNGTVQPNPVAVQNLEVELNGLLDCEETYWRQRSRVTWLRNEDRNTHFVHTKASQRHSRNVIRGLRDSNGVWREEGVQVNNIIHNYFSTIFQSSEPVSVSLQTVLDSVEPKVTNYMNRLLLASITSSDIKATLDDMSPSKAPGRNGMPGFILSEILEKFWARVNDRLTLRKCLKPYEEASGQSINIDKSCIAFNPTLDFNICRRLAHVLVFGLSSVMKNTWASSVSIGHNRKMAFESIQDKVWKRLQAWKEKLFSVGGKKVLLKAVIQAIPTYTMACFKLLVALCKELARLCDHFWWGSTDVHTKIH
ncbi:hypothetical protein Dsin_030653 [Dipteronia sinensis]|uniref:Reverse transcriptase n=1 Tax=Dipteronia sinensis TaxID=43782 RepID=A0AAD9ZK15_9ROSI|nr:hypothetical protein Dsin_030653 [Dipteronia sinensis]